MKKNSTLLYFFLLATLTFSINFPVLSFSFWRDDWAFFWGAVNNDRSFLTLLFHPGTMVEFYLLSRVFGQHMILWNIFGIFLKLIASWSVYQCVREVGKSEKIGRLGGLLFAVIPVGLEAVGWSAAHVVLLDTIFVCYSLVFFIRYQQTKRKLLLYIFLLFVFLAIASDPIRSIPDCLLPFLWMLIMQQVAFRLNKKLVASVLGIAGLCIAGAVYLSRTMLVDYLVFKSIRYHGFDPLFYLIKTTAAAKNYFSSVGNILTGAFIPTVNDMRLSSSDAHVVSIAIGIFAFLCIVYIGYKKKLRTQLRIPYFFLIWVFLFYVPNWVFTLQLTVGFTNRYAVISSVGVVVMLSYVVYQISNAKLRKSVMVLLMLFFGVQTLHLLLVHQEFRDLTLHTMLYGRMEKDIPVSYRPYLLMISGNHVAVKYSMLYNMQMPIVMERNIPTRVQFPIFVDTNQRAISYICGKTKSFSAAWQFIPVPVPPTVDDVYSWNVDQNGTITTHHEAIRNEIQKLLKREGCENVLPMKPL